LVDQLSDLRTYFDDIEEKIASYITWQDSVEGITVDLPRIEESHKETVLREWEIHLKHAETMVFNARDISNDLVETTSDNLFQANLISDYPKGTLFDIKLLTKTSQELSKKKNEKIEKLSKIDLKCHWHFLVKPHSQWLMLRFLSNTTTHMLPTLKDATIFTSQMQIQP